MTEFLEFNIKPHIVERVTVFDDLPDGALTDISEISALACRSRASIWRDVHEGRLSQPHKVGPNATRWYVGAVRRYLNGGE
ncbi:MAG: transcriptional regulator [Rhodospirillales bacterium]|jgi:predicted DNA-binding transcriptional regulator AlpA|nr:transcriptional regulator [Rhodospirillales bacterium]